MLAQILYRALCAIFDIEIKIIEINSLQNLSILLEIRALANEFSSSVFASVVHW